MAEPLSFDDAVARGLVAFDQDTGGSYFVSWNGCQDLGCWEHGGPEQSCACDLINDLLDWVRTHG